ncbi:MAG: hypothetical protein WAQ29_05855, partial [Nitrososphaeraceae archaeon]
VGYSIIVSFSGYSIIVSFSGYSIIVSFSVLSLNTLLSSLVYVKGCPSRVCLLCLLNNIQF